VTFTLGGLTYVRPPDTGCEYSPSCLDCPLPVCKWDLNSERPNTKTVLRALMILKLHGEDGLGVHRISFWLGCSVRTVQRDLYLMRKLTGNQYL